MPRTGKIARLPEALREELNRRLYHGIPGRVLLAWLNDHPDVQNVLRHSFDGRPLNAPNLTHWKQGGYAEWQARKEIEAEVRKSSGNPASFESDCAAMVHRDDLVMTGPAKRKAKKEDRKEDAAHA